MEARGSRFLGADGGVRTCFEETDIDSTKGKDHVVVFKQLLRAEEKKTRTYSLRETRIHSRKNKGQFVNRQEWKKRRLILCPQK